MPGAERARPGYGEWPSPLTAASVARGQREPGFPAVVRGEIWWQEPSPQDEGRTKLLRLSGDGTLDEPLGADTRWNVRTRVHEYGGRSYLVLPDGGVAFTDYADQRIYRLAPGGVRRPISPDTGCRYAELTLSPGGAEIWCVRERHVGDRVIRALVAVPLSGEGDGVRVLSEGSGFYSGPAISPDGRWLAVITWDHPRMPWDGTELRIARIVDGTSLTAFRTLMGGPDESVQAPLWRDEHTLFAISDRSGWWNPYLLDVNGSPPEQVCPIDEEFAGPPWQLGISPYGVLGDGRLAVLHGRGTTRLGVLDPERGTVEDVDLPFDCWERSLSVAGTTVVGVAASPRHPWSLVRVDVADGTWQVLRRAIDELPDDAYLPLPTEITVTRPDGRTVPAYVYPPSNPAFAAEPVTDELPPYVLWIHGGPTGQAGSDLDLRKVFFTSRGIGVVDVDYTGSCGYGRSYRQALRGAWGIDDVHDVVAVAEELVRWGIADPARLAIRGGSAGGWTVLAAITSSSVFAAAVSYYGVSTLDGFAEETHDFESRYIDELIGSSERAVQREREPLSRVDDISCPVLLLQGLDDPVVRPRQAERMVDALQRNSLPYFYLAFAGESHGFRKEETIVACLEAELSFYGQMFGFDPPGIPPAAPPSA